MAWNKFKRTARKVARKTIGAIGKGAVMVAKARYGNVNGLANLKKDVTMIKNLINIEKKYIENINASADLKLGQVSVNTSGHYLIDLTANPAIGTGVQARTGSSIKVTGSYFKFLFKQQSSVTQPIRGKIYVFRNNGDLQTVSSSQGESTVTPSLLSPNLWVYGLNSSTNIYDYNSTRNIDKLKGWKCLRTVGFTLPPDNYAGINILKDVNFAMKYKNYHVRFSKDTSTVTEGQLLLLLVLDNGNSDGTTASTLSAIGATATNTGVTFNYSYRHYYVDN